MQILEFQLASGFYYEPCKIINKGLDRQTGRRIDK